VSFIIINTNLLITRIIKSCFHLVVVDWLNVLYAWTYLCLLDLLHFDIYEEYRGK